MIDLNFLTKQNATEENKIFEVLTTIFLECDEYNKSMLVFDIDSLIMLNKSDSDMAKSTSISNLRLYQFIREKCKTANVERENQEQQQQEQTANQVRISHYRLQKFPLTSMMWYLFLFFCFTDRCKTS